jgi:cytochrome c biogenesis protein CcmG, thiol:disulfide interchange protein DsbE
MRLTSRLLPVLVAFIATGAAASAQNISSLTQLLTTPGGEKVSIAKLGEGKVTVVSFWATWCKPCKEEMKAMQPLYDKMKAEGHGFEYIAISIDNTKTMAKVGPFIASKSYTFPVLLDPNSEMFLGLNGTQVPYTLIFRADGSLAKKHDGYLEGDEAKLEAELMELMASNGGAGGANAATPAE